MTQTENDMGIELTQLQLPDAVSPQGAYESVIVCRGFAFVSGQLPRSQGELRYCGTVGIDLSLDEAKEAAMLCAGNALAALKKALGGFERVIGLCRVTGYVACTSTFNEHPAVLDAASEYLIKALGENGRHSRTTIGVISLPRRAPVEIDIIAAIRE
jgi:enamine deaminase RidA (YjgF/YER057c/UK114 family)